MRNIFRNLSAGYLLFLTVHIIQFVLAIVVCGLYGIDLDRARKAHKYADGKWVYAVAVGGLSAISSILLCIPYILRFVFVWGWNLILFILWIALFGVFGRMYIKENPEGNADIERMKRAVWVVLTNALLWLLTTVASFAYWWTHRERRTRFTSRATV